MYEYPDGSGNESDGRPQSRRDKQENGNGNGNGNTDRDHPESKRLEPNSGGGRGNPPKHHASVSGRGDGARSQSRDKVGGDDMW